MLAARTAGFFAGIFQALTRGFPKGWNAPTRYEPSKHYMRGPGPKSEAAAKRPLAAGSGAGQPANEAGRLGHAS